MRGVRRDAGASFVEYGAIILLVGAILAAVSVFAVPESVKTGTLASICRVFKSAEECASSDDPGPGTETTAPPSGPALPPPTAGPPGTVPAAYPEVEGLDPNDPDVQKYIQARQEADAANQGVSDLENDADELKKALIDFLLDVVGYKDLEKCFTTGDIVACLSTLASIVPWGKVLKLLKKVPDAIKLGKKLKEIWDKVAAAKKRKKAADDALDEADDLIKNKPKVCPIRPPSSFVPGTRVLLADGTSRPIERIRVGDLVLAGDPAGGQVTAQPVTALRSSAGPKRLVDVATGPLGLLGPVVTATTAHPFYDPERRTWTDAGNLARGTVLASVTERTAVTAVRGRIAARRVHNLSVAGPHTYYVLAGGVPVLVHNEAPIDPCKVNWNANSVKTFGHTFSDHAKSVKQLADRAKNLGGPQGRWPDQNKAAEFMRSVWKPGQSGAVEYDMPPGLGEVVFEDGTVKAVTRMRIVYRPNGMIKTAYPIL